MSEYICTNKFDTNECPNIFVKEKLIRTNVRIYIRDQYIRIFEYSNIFVTLCFGSPRDCGTVLILSGPDSVTTVYSFGNWLLNKQGIGTFFSSKKRHWAQVLVPATVYLILTTVYWHLWYWVPTINWIGQKGPLQFIGSLGHYFTPAHIPSSIMKI